MPRVEILVPRRSPSEVIERIAEQTAGPEVSELLDPVRYHGTPGPTQAFELRRYDWRPVRTGRARFKTVFRIELSARGADTAVAIATVISTRYLVISAIGATPIVIVLVALLGRPRQDMTGAIVGASLFTALYFWIASKGRRQSLEAERAFLAQWLGGQ